MLKPHHLKNLPQPIAAAITSLYKMHLSEDVLQHATAEIARWKVIPPFLA